MNVDVHPTGNPVGGRARHGRVSIVVPSRGRSSKVLRLLANLVDQSPESRSEIRDVVIALDGDPSGCGELQSRAASAPFAVKIRDLPRVGISAAKNAAIGEAEGRILLFVNDDVEPTPDFIHQHVLAHEAGHRIVLGDAPWARPADPTLLDAAIARTPMVFFYDRLVDGESADFRHAWNLNLSIDRGLIEDQSEVFAERLRPFMYEDLELVYRLRGTAPAIHFRAAARAIHNHRYGLEDYFVRESMLGVMAPALAEVNASCFETVFGASLDAVVERARAALALDVADGQRAARRLRDLANRPFQETASCREVELFYLAHLPLKRRAFRCGFMAAVGEPQADWTERPKLAAAALQRDPVFRGLVPRADGRP